MTPSQEFQLCRNTGSLLGAGVGTARMRVLCLVLPIQGARLSKMAVSYNVISG